MRILYTILTLALTSCASTEHANGTLYKEYQEYRALVDSNDATAASKQFSKEFLKEMKEIDNNIPPELGLISPLWKYLASEIRTEHSHFEKIDKNKGCLTINGLNARDEPSSLSLYYIKENDNWVFNYSGFTAHDSIRDYYTEPTCPITEE